jgi:hypothetical protein
MKKLIIAIALAITFSANAQTLVDIIPAGLSVTRFIVDLTDKDKLENTPPVTVQASGTGNTCDQALLNAKRYALEKVNGTWVTSTQRSTDGSYNEDIVQYSGGVIKSYKYLRNDCTFVIIEAEVAKRSNRVQMEQADVTQGQIIHLAGIKDARDKKQEAIRAIDSRQEAIWFKPKKTEMAMIENTNDVVVRIDGEFSYKDKWRADYLELREMIGYFNLPSFAGEPTIVIKGFDSSKKEVFKTSFVYQGELKLWQIRSYGATRTVEVKTNRTEEAKVNFRIPYNKLENVRSFIVEVI